MVVEIQVLEKGQRDIFFHVAGDGQSLQDDHFGILDLCSCFPVRFLIVGMLMMLRGHVIDKS